MKTVYFYFFCFSVLTDWNSVLFCQYKVCAVWCSPCFSHRFESASGLCTYQHISSQNYVERIPLWECSLQIIVHLSP